MKQIFNLFFSLSITLAFAQSTYTVQLNSQKIDSLLQLLEENTKFMGSVALAHDGKTIYKNAVGYLDAAREMEATTTTKYRIGSISKTFTATLVMLAIENDKLKLDQTLSAFFPDIENASLITIRNLLSHRSGIASFTDGEEYLTWNTEPQSREDMLSRVIKGGSDFEPSAKSEYSNSNYILLTFILEDVYNMSFSDILNSQIVEPLKLKNTYVGNKIEVQNNEALSYTYNGDWSLSSETDMSVPLGAGAIVSTPEDLNVFMTALYEGRIVSEQSLTEMQNKIGRYGLGMFTFPYDEKVSWGHTGGIDGFRSVSSYFKDDKLAISMISNAENYASNNILLAILDAYFKGDFEMPVIKPSIVLTEVELENYIGVYKTDQIPVEIQITQENNILFAQATGQNSFPLDAQGDHVFTFDQAGVKITFNPEDRSMILYQGGGEFTFTRE